MTSTVGIPTDRAAFKEDLELYLEEFSRLRDEEIAQQAKGGDCWWLAFTVLVGDPSQLHGPKLISDDRTPPLVGAAVVAETEEEAKEWILSRLGPGYAKVNWVTVQNHGARWTPLQGAMDHFSIWPTHYNQATRVAANEIRYDTLKNFDRFGHGRFEFYKRSTYELVKGAVSGGYDLQEDQDIEELTIRILSTLALGGRISPDDIPEKS